MLGSLMRSNSNQVQKAFDLITSHDTRKVGLLGLSFKAGTDDLRESPLVELAEMLIGKGYELRIFDRNVEYARVHGPTRNTSSRRSRTSPHCWSPTSTKWWRVPMCWCWAMATSCSSTW